MTYVQQIEIAELQPNSAQNSIRHCTDAAVASIVKSAAEKGIVTPLIVVKNGDGYVIADGHRRWAAACDLGLTTLPCVVRNGDPVALWAELNASMRAIRGADWYAGWSQLVGVSRDRFLEIMPKGSRNAIRSMILIFGETRAREIGRLGKFSPTISTKVYCVTAAIAARLGRAPSKLRVGEWLLKYGGGAAQFVKLDPSKKLLMKLSGRIRKDLPFPRADWV